jgi:hypothetical protein
MKTNLTLSVVGLAALLSSPAMAEQKRPLHNAAPLAVPSDARGSVAPYGLNEGGPYTPSIPTVPSGNTRDFQNGSRG